MYIAVTHNISEPREFWEGASKAMPSLPKNIILHQSFPSPDGKKAVCIWEAESVEVLRNLLESVSGQVSQNDYFAIENKEGIMLPKLFQQRAGAA
ncbi:MAG: hypothetical protein AB7O65_01740 [Candidatus Korobacteraceae bacterium]